MDDANTIAIKLLGELNKISEQNNTMAYNDFMEYHSLFLIDGVEMVGEDQYKHLSEKWLNNVDPYEKVQVIDDGKVVITLPPMFNRASEINKFTDKADEVMNMVQNAFRKNNPLTLDKEKAESLLNICVKQSMEIDKGEHARRVNEYATIMDNLKRTNNGEQVEQDSSNDLGCDMLDWD